MVKNDPNIGASSAPRFEFRTFGQSFDLEAYRMARLSEPVPESVWERRSDEIYVMSRATSANNTKIRDGKMDIKTLVQTLNGLEQWNPLLKAEFPLSRETMAQAICPAFQVPLPLSDKEVFSQREFLRLIGEQASSLQAVRVRKRRFGYLINGTICERAEVLINGARVVTLSCESTEIEQIEKAIREVGLEKYQNINYLQAIKRVIGMIEEPLADESL